MSRCVSEIWDSRGGGGGGHMTSYILQTAKHVKVKPHCFKMMIFVNEVSCPSSGERN